MKIKSFFFLFLSFLLLKCDNNLVELPSEESLSTIQNRGNMQLMATMGLSATIPADVSPDFIWGINGHPLTQTNYNNNVIGTPAQSLRYQFLLARELGTTYYRIDLNVDDNGVLKQSTAPDWIKGADLFNEAPGSGITLLPVLNAGIKHVLNNGSSPSVAYNYGLSVWTNFIRTYKCHINSTNNVYELDNEIEGYALNHDSLGNYAAGREKSDYDPAKMQVLGKYLLGGVQAIHTEDPGSRVIINISNGTHYGFFKWLIEDFNVPFDILGFHYYDGLEGLEAAIVDVSAVDTVLTRPIWITEVNEDLDDYTKNNPNYESIQSEYITTAISKLSNKPRVQAFFLYELFESEQHKDSHFRECGTIRLPNYVAFDNHTQVKKQGFYNYKFKVEETKRGFEDFIFGIYLYCNKRVADPSGLTYWSQRLKASRNPQQIINEFLPLESFGRFVDDQYLYLFGRAADPSGHTYWENQLINGMTREALIREFCKSDDFFIGLNEGYIQKVYLKLLGRGAEPSAVTYWLNRFSNGETKHVMISEIMGSDDCYYKFVRDQYSLLLNTTPDAAGELYWVNRMKNGLNQLDLVKEFLTGEDFWSRTIREGYERNNSPFLFYQQ
jgi:hypothetical protein